MFDPGSMWFPPGCDFERDSTSTACTKSLWGKGLAAEAARAAMQWAVVERSVKQYVAETEKTDWRSGRVLQKMGLGKSGIEYWKDSHETGREKVL